MNNPISYLYKQIDETIHRLDRLTVYKVHMKLTDSHGEHFVACNVATTDERIAKRIGIAEMEHWYPSDRIEFLYVEPDGNIIVEGRDFLPNSV